MLPLLPLTMNGSTCANTPSSDGPTINGLTGKDLVTTSIASNALSSESVASIGLATTGLISNNNAYNAVVAGISGASKLRRMLEDEREGLIVCPGVYDGFSTRIALSVGFKALYMV